MKKLLFVLFLLGCGSNQQNSDWAAPKVKIKKAATGLTAEAQKVEPYFLDDELQFHPNNEVVSVYVESKCAAQGRIYESKYYAENNSQVSIRSIVPSDILSLEPDETLCDLNISIKNLLGSQKLYQINEVHVVPQDFRVEFLAHEALTEQPRLDLFDVKITNHLSRDQAFKIPLKNKITYVLTMTNAGGFVYKGRAQTAQLEYDFLGKEVMLSESVAVLNIPANTSQMFTVYSRYGRPENCMVTPPRLVGIDFDFAEDLLSYDFVLRVSDNKGKKAVPNFLKNQSKTRAQFFLRKDHVPLPTAEHIITLPMSGPFCD